MNAPRTKTMRTAQHGSRLTTHDSRLTYPVCGFILLMSACSLGSRDTASAELTQLSADIWQRMLERSTAVRLREGLPIDELPPLTYQRAEEDALFSESVLQRAEAIGESGLTHDEIVTLETIRWDATMTVEGLQYFWLQSFLTPYSSPLPGLRQIFSALQLESDEDLNRYIELLGQVPQHVSRVQRLASGQLERGVVVSAANLPAVVGLVRASIEAPNAGAFAVTDDRLGSFGQARIDMFRGRIATVVNEEINPTLRELAEFLEGPYATQAPSGVGISQYPNGAEYYRYLTRRNTTMDVTPQEVQRIGYELLAEFRERMAEIQAELGFSGTRDEFHLFLRTDPRFFPKSPEEVAERLKSASDSMFARIGDFFFEIPQAPYGVRRLHRALEPTQTFGYYDRPTASDPVGYYNYNGSKLDERSWVGLEAISFHELVPGHHFQIALQNENEALPAFRTAAYYTAFGEGWGSYSSQLALEAGMYRDPYSRYGMYVMESFLATRLVVDPGMNYLGMSLEDARQFMRENTLASETEIATESLRYSTDLPGQALGYQMGKRKILDLRSRARVALGDRFDIRRFHEAVLRNGAVPMVVLERQVDRFVEQER